MIKKDITNAQILKLHLYRSAENYFDYKTDRIKCDKCNKMINMQNESIILNRKIKTKYDIFTNYLGMEEIIVSEKLKNIFELENINCVSYDPIYYKNKGNIIAGYYHLKIPETEMELIEPTILVQSGYCDKCKRYNTQLIKSVMYFNGEKYHNEDMTYTKEWFGGDSKRRQNKNVIISKNMYEILERNNINKREWSVTPAFMK